MYITSNMRVLAVLLILLSLVLLVVIGTAALGAMHHAAAHALAAGPDIIDHSH